ncbi:MAG: glycosyltransferase [Acidimicrobiales bacterium]
MTEGPVTEGPVTEGPVTEGPVAPAARGRIAFVPPRFGPGVVGGAEAVCREAAVGLSGRGWDVEVLTSCAVDHTTWANDLPAGETREEGLVVRRFEMVHDGTRAGLRAQRQIERGQVPAIDDQVSWQSLAFRSPGLFHHLLRAGADYDAVVFAPYLFWTATVCLPVVSDRAVVIPCLHDETYARLDVVRPVLASPAQVWFLSDPEHRLAHRLGPVAARHRVVGAGVVPPDGYDPHGFRARHGISRPFVLYAGRRELDKGWPQLLDTFARAVAAGDVELDLVTAGVGAVSLPDSAASTVHGRIIDVGLLDQAELGNAFAAATAYVQPSRMESFSRSIMESWLAATPVLAVKGSEVVGWHLERCGGGLVYGDHADLADGMRRLVQDPAGAAAMAERGRRYVLDNYTWPAVLDRMEEDLESLPSRGPRRADAAAGQRPGRPPVLVVGSYPPVTGPAAAATLGAVRTAYAGGERVVVAAPRQGAAHLHARISGPVAGLRLDRLRRQSGATRLVLCAEAGLPVPTGGEHGPARRLEPAVLAWLQRRTVAGLVKALDRFEAVTMVVTGDLEVPARVLRPLWPPVHQVQVGAGARGAGELTRRLGVPAGLAGVEAPAIRAVPAGGRGGAPAPGLGGVTLWGPPEVLARERPRQAMSVAARAVLGPAAPTVRAWLVGARRRGMALIRPRA